MQNKTKKKTLQFFFLLNRTEWSRSLTWISKIKVVFKVAGYVLLLSGLYPVGIGLLVVADEHSEEDDHRDLPDEAHHGQAEPHAAVLLSSPDFHHGDKQKKKLNKAGEKSLV